MLNLFCQILSFVRWRLMSYFMPVPELCQILSSKLEAPITPEQGRTNLLSLLNTLWPLSCSVNLHAGLTEVTEQEKLRVPALQLNISPHGVACESGLTGRFYFQLQPSAMALLLTGFVPIGQSQSILVACQPQMPEACPHFLSPYMMKSAGSHSL